MNMFGFTSQLNPARVKQVLDRIGPFIVTDAQIKADPDNTALLGTDFRNLSEVAVKEIVLPDLKLTEGDFNKMEEIAGNLEKRAAARESIEKSETPTSAFNKAYLKSRINQIKRNHK